MNVDLKYLKNLVSDKSNFGENMTISYNSMKKDQFIIDTIQIKMNRKAIYGHSCTTLPGYYNKDEVLEGMIKFI